MTVSGNATQFVTTEHVGRLTSEMRNAAKQDNLEESSPDEEEWEEISEKYAQKARNRRMSGTVTGEILERGKISRRIRNELSNTEIDENDLVIISEKIGHSISDIFSERFSEIEDAIEDDDPDRLAQLSKMILTGIVGNFVEEFFDLFSKFSNEILNAIIDVISMTLS